MATCKEVGCDGKAVGDELCRKHYMRKRRKGTTDDTRKNARKPCREDGCKALAAAHGLCERHYRAPHRVEQRAVATQALIEQRASEDRPCLQCGEQIPAERTRRSTFCSTRCKDAHRNRPEVREARGFGSDYMRAASLMKNFGLTVDAYLEMFASQGNCCALCKSTSSGWRGGFHVDHCHETGKVRGILCRHCNLMLGHAKDSVETLQRAIEYLMA